MTSSCLIDEFLVESPFIVLGTIVEEKIKLDFYIKTKRICAIKGFLCGADLSLGFHL